jgi:hypothetical protein
MHFPVTPFVRHMNVRQTTKTVLTVTRRDSIGHFTAESLSMMCWIECAREWAACTSKTLKSLRKRAASITVHCRRMTV